MTDSLRDQLLKLGFAQPAPTPKPEKPRHDQRPAQRSDRGGQGRPEHAGSGKQHHGPGRPQEQRSGRPPDQRSGKPQDQRNGRPPDQRSGKPQDRGSQRPDARRNPAAGGAPSSAPNKPKTAGELDLAHAYALRAKAEKAERERIEQEAIERARLKKERKEKLTALLTGKGLNDAAADVARHFPHGDKIRRIYVTPDQLKRLNAGELGVVQLAGRFMLVERAIALEAQAIAPEALVLLVDPNAPAEDDIPADLVW